MGLGPHGQGPDGFSMGHARAFIPLASVIWALRTHNANPVANGRGSLPGRSNAAHGSKACRGAFALGAQWLARPSALSIHDARLIKTLPGPSLRIRAQSGKTEP